MEIVRHGQAVPKQNSAFCNVLEYLTKNKDIDFAKAIIIGREPEMGMAENTVCTELVL